MMFLVGGLYKGGLFFFGFFPRFFLDFFPFSGGRKVRGRKEGRQGGREGRKEGGEGEGKGKGKGREGHQLLRLVLRYYCYRCML